MLTQVSSSVSTAEVPVSSPPWKVALLFIEFSSSHVTLAAQETCNAFGLSLNALESDLSEDALALVAQHRDVQV